MAITWFNFTLMNIIGLSLHLYSVWPGIKYLWLPCCYQYKSRPLCCDSKLIKSGPNYNPISCTIFLNPCQIFYHQELISVLSHYDFSCLLVVILIVQSFIIYFLHWPFGHLQFIFNDLNPMSLLWRLPWVSEEALMEC